MSDETFEGFVPPTKNYFPMPNEWIDICARIDNLAELKVIQYVLRHTWGYREYGITKTISVDEFMKGRKRHDGKRMDNGTGLKSDRSVKDGIRAAIKHGYLIHEVDTSDPARTRKSYALKMIGTGVVSTSPVDTTPVNDENTGVVSTPLTGSIYPPQGYNLPPRQVDTTPRTEKDTRERHLEKDTLEKQESIAPTTLSPENDSHSHAGYTKLPARPAPIPFAEQAKAISEKRQTDPALPIVKPPQQTPLPQSQAPGQPDVAPPASVGKGTAQAGAGKRTQKKVAQEPAGPPIMPPDDSDWGTTTCLHLFDYWRGAPQLDLGQIKYAASCAKKLAANYTRAQVVRVYEAMSTDTYWIDRGGVDVCDVARHMSKEWNKLQKIKPLKPRKDETRSDERVSDFDRYVGNGPEAREELVRYAEELIAKGEIERAV